MITSAVSGVTFPDDMPSLREIPARAEEIIAKPGFIIGTDASELRDLLADLTWVLLQSLDEFGRMCHFGDLAGALGFLTAQGRRPDLGWKSRPLGHTYVDLLVIGYAGHASLGGERMRSNYIKLLSILLTAGVPVDNPDFVGKTSLHHAARDSGTGDIIKVLLKCGAKVDLQDRFGASPLLVAMQEDSADVIPLLLDGGASLDVTDGEGSSPRSTYPTRPANVSRVVKDWLVRHKGKKAVLQGDRCSKCGSSCASMKRCARCRSRLYCSPGCQSADWGEHKKNCQPFDKEENLLIVRPKYAFGNSQFVSTISIVPSSFGFSRGPNPSGNFEANVRGGKNMIIKIQVPFQGNGALLVYNKKRTFECALDYDENTAAYMKIKKIIAAKGILGLKAYFPAELRSKDELAINVVECLPESRF